MFSVIIPLYNKGRLIKNSISSILSQNCQDFEIVVVDDGSTDDSAHYVKQFCDPRIKYYYKKNGGVSSARNYGIEKAAGEWVIFLDADDEMLPDTLSAYEEIINKDKPVPFIVARQDNIYEGHGFVQNLINKNRKLHYTKYPFFAHWLRLFFPCPGTVCISKKHIIERGGFNECLSFYEDIEWMIRMMKDSRVCYIPHFALRYNQDGSGLSGSSHPLEKEMAYYIPEQIETASFWHKALLYENLEAEILWWQQHGNEQNVKFYQDMQEQYFSWIFKALHWVRQKMIRRGII